MKDSNLKESNNLYGFRDKELFEKTIKAVTLLSEVVRYYPEMIFKGGTSVLLRTGKPERLSIDIDIILDKKEEQGLSEKLAMIFDSKKNAIRKGYETSEIKNARLNDKYKILERLKRVNPDAYAYWYYAKGES